MSFTPPPSAPDAAPAVPSRSDAPSSYIAKMNAFLAWIATFGGWLGTFVAYIVTLLAELTTYANTLLAAVSGGAFGVDYSFSTTTTASDPGSGKLRLNHATQNLATAIYLDLLDAAGANWQDALDLFDDSSSVIKGYLTIRAAGDGTKFLVFQVTGMAANSGYRTATVVCSAYSSASPFANDAAITVSFVPKGDKGDDGDTGPVGRVAGLPYAYSTTTTASDPGAGLLRLDNATLSLATKLYVSETDGDGNSAAADLATWDDNGNGSVRGYLRIIKAADVTKFALFQVTGAITDGGSWGTFNLTYISSSGTFSDTDPVVLQFRSAGGDSDVVSTTLSVSGTASLVKGNSGQTVDCTGAVTLNPDSAATLADGWEVKIIAGSGDVTVTGIGSVAAHCSAILRCKSGSSMQLIQLGLAPIASYFPVAASGIDIEPPFTTDFNKWRIEIDLEFSTSATLVLQVKSGGSYLTTSTYHYHEMAPNSSSTSYTGYSNTANNSIPFAAGSPSGAGSSLSVKLFVTRLSSTTIKKVLSWFGAYVNSSGYSQVTVGAAHNTTTGAITGIRLAPSAGTFTGTVRVYPESH